MKYRLNTNRSKYNDFKSLINLKIMRIIDNYYNNENETIWYNNIKNMKLGIEPKYGRVRSMNYKRKYNNDDYYNNTKETNFREKSKLNKSKYIINNLVNKKENKAIDIF